jgi:DNA-binding transcriptional regulator YiaG
MIKHGETPTPEQIRKAREKAKMTQAEAAALIYYKWRTWDRWEKGEREGKGKRTCVMHPALWELWQIKAKLEQLELGTPK